MEDERWTVKDKLEQFRSVKDLYSNTHENIKDKISAQRKKYNKEIKNLVTQNKKYRQQYEEVLHGDKKNLTTILNTHPTMQLAMKNLNPQQIEEELKQTIFCKNKELDRLRYKRKNLEEVLLNKKLEFATLQNKSDENTENYLWEQEIANQLENISVKLNTARANRDVYEKALNILQKDAIRFDEVIEELKKDLIQQSESIMRAVEMGQNLNEELNSLQKKYRETERAVRDNMRQRNRALRSLRSEIDNIRLQGQTVQRESHAGLLPHQSRNDLESDSETNFQTIMKLNLQNETSAVKGMIGQVKEAAMVHRIQDIYPRIEKQKKQKAWLQNQVEQTQAQLTRMIELHNQLDIMLEVTMYHTLTDEARQLREERIQLFKEIDEEKKNVQDTQAELVSIGNKIVYIRTALLTFNMMIDTVMPGHDTSVTELKIISVSNTSMGVTPLGGLVQPNSDALTLMKQVSTKVKLLLDKVGTMEVTASKLPTHTADAPSTHVGFEDEADNIVSEMLHDLEDMDDPSVPTRKDIKAESKRLVELYDNPRAMFQTDSGPKYKKHKCF